MYFQHRSRGIHKNAYGIFTKLPLDGIGINSEQRHPSPLPGSHQRPRPHSADLSHTSAIAAAATDIPRHCLANLATTNAVRFRQIHNHGPANHPRPRPGNQVIRITQAKPARPNNHPAKQIEPPKHKPTPQTHKDPFPRLRPGFSTFPPCYLGGAAWRGRRRYASGAPPSRSPPGFTPPLPAIAPPPPPHNHTP